MSRPSSRTWYRRIRAERLRLHVVEGVPYIELHLVCRVLSNPRNLRAQAQLHRYYAGALGVGDKIKVSSSVADRLPSLLQTDDNAPLCPKITEVIGENATHGTKSGCYNGPGPQTHRGVSVTLESGRHVVGRDEPAASRPA